MSKMKSLGLMYAMAAMMGGDAFAHRSSHEPVEKKNRKPIVPPKPKGLRMFNVDGVEVWAINEKNARRKAANLGGIS